LNFLFIKYGLYNTLATPRNTALVSSKPKASSFVSEINKNGEVTKPITPMVPKKYEVEASPFLFIFYLGDRF
jgi:hypothetical protein